MANYTSSTSDKSKKKAIRFLLFGGIGLHRFYVGKIKSGIVAFVFGLFCWIMIISGIKETEAVAIGIGLVLLALANVPDLIKLALGTFRDNVGQPLRQ